eukprot:m.236656 g.236656  ORF g.236656 m.236656 type:complete len:208 (+) comp13006_c0_seq1:44-667(+)
MTSHADRTRDGSARTGRARARKAPRVAPGGGEDLMQILRRHTDLIFYLMKAGLIDEKSEDTRGALEELLAELAHGACCVVHVNDRLFRSTADSSRPLLAMLFWLTRLGPDAIVTDDMLHWKDAVRVIFDRANCQQGVNISTAPDRGTTCASTPSTTLSRSTAWPLRSGPGQPSPPATRAHRSSRAPRAPSCRSSSMPAPRWTRSARI